MRIATSNAISGSSVSLLDGTLLSSSASNMLNADFSDTTVIEGSSANIQFEITNIANIDYLWLGGVSASGGGYVITVECGTFSQTFTPAIEGRSYWFDMSDDTTSGDITITIFYDASNTISIGCIMAGASVEVPNGGVVGGQPLPALEYDNAVANNSNLYANPTTQMFRRKAMKANWNIPNIPRETFTGASGFRNSIQLFHDLINSFGLAAVYDDTGLVPGSSNYYENYAVYAVTNSRFSYDSRTNKLMIWRFASMGAK